MIAESCIPLPLKGKRGRKPTPETLALRDLATRPIGHSRHFSYADIARDTYADAQRLLCLRAHHAAGSGWYATRQSETGVRVFKVAEPQKFHGRDGGVANNAPPVAA